MVRIAYSQATANNQHTYNQPTNQPTIHVHHEWTEIIRTKEKLHTEMKWNKDRKC